MFKLFASSLLVLLFVNKCLCEGGCRKPENVPCRNNSNACEFICANDVCEIRTVVILPNSTDLIASLPEVRFIFILNFQTVFIRYLA